jgi:hypothetical protein
MHTSAKFGLSATGTCRRDVRTLARAALFTTPLRQRCRFHRFRRLALERVRPFPPLVRSLTVSQGTAHHRRPRGAQPRAARTALARPRGPARAHAAAQGITEKRFAVARRWVTQRAVAHGAQCRVAQAGVGRRGSARASLQRGRGDDMGHIAPLSAASHPCTNGCARRCSGPRAGGRAFAAHACCCARRRAAQCTFESPMDLLTCAACNCERPVEGVCGCSFSATQ